MGATQAIDVLSKKGIQDVKFTSPDQKTPFFKFPYQIKEFWDKQKQILQTLSSKDFETSLECVTLIQDLTNLQFQEKSKVKLRGFFDLIKHYEKQKKVAEEQEKKQNQSPSIMNKTEEYIFKELIPFIADLALKQRQILDPDFPNGLPILIKGRKDAVTLNRQHACCILACMFLNITQNRAQHFDSADLPHSMQEQTNAIQFMTMDFKSFPPLIHKFFCFFNYFNQIKEKQESQVFLLEKITIKRVCPTPEEFKQLSLSFWENSQTKLQKAEVCISGRIQDCPIDKKSQIDFANKFIGGLSMGPTYTQQDILFDTAPQCIISMLNCQRMCSNQAIVLIGVNRYSDYTGYGSGFKFMQLKQKQNPEIPREIIAIDALHFAFKEQIAFQWTPNVILRELNKAFIGFNGAGMKRVISTGKWGCGAFKGDVQLKFLIQWMAASQCGREMFYYGFGDKELELSDKVVENLKGKTVGELFRLVGLHNKSGIFNKLV